MSKKKRAVKRDAAKLRSVVMQMRLDPAESETLSLAAELSGISLAAWCRERLRRVAGEELRGAGRPVAFLSQAAG